MAQNNELKTARVRGLLNFSDPLVSELSLGRAEGVASFTNKILPPLTNRQVLPTLCKRPDSLYVRRDRLAKLPYSGEHPADCHEGRGQPLLNVRPLGLKL